MDRSLYRRPGIQTQSQITKTPFENQAPVAKVNSSRVSSPIPRTALLARRLPIDMSLPGEKESLRIHELLRRNKIKRFRRNLTKATAYSLVIFILFGGFLFSESYLKIHKVFRGSTLSAAALKSNVNPNLLKSEGSGRVNVLLLGRGGGNHDGPDLTDSMMVASIDPVNNKITLVSLPRDMWVNVPGAGVMKINAAWESGEFKYLGKTSPGSTDPNAISAGFDLADKTISQVLGINIDYNAIVDFQAFQQAVDTVGGVTVNVPSELVDPTMAWENKGNPVLAQAGIQNFNGKQALIYVRSRETSSDFARAQRQRDVLVAIEQKALSLQTLSNPFKITSLLNTFGNNVATDISISDASQIYNIFKRVSSNNIVSLDLNSAGQIVTTGNMNGQSIVLPSAGLFNYSAIHQFVQSQLKDPYIMKENARVLILNGTSTPGLATNMSNELKNYGYDVIGSANTPTADWSNTTLIDLNSSDKYTNHYLEKRLGVSSVNKLPINSIPTNGADFVIIIGSNEANSSQTQTN